MTRTSCRPGSVMSAGYEKPPCGPVAAGSVKPSTRSRAPTTGDLPRRTLPNAYCQFDVFGFHGRTTSVRGTLMRAGPEAVATDLLLCSPARCGAARLAGVNSACVSEPALALWTLRNGGRLFGGGNSVLSPPRAKTISPGRTPPFDDVGEPPIVIATYSLPSTE